jgi:glutamyl-tRNA(Gln) amidotransferase subunit E
MGLVVKIGIEIHQQLNTGKLFCRCSGELSEKPLPAFRRTLHPVTSEIGQVDRAALIEARRGKEIQYFADAETSCAVEWDEEPPHEPDPEAVRIAAQIARALGAKPVDEVHFMRKILIDGSAVSGFQRTALIATGGSVDGIGISSVCLE